MPIAAGRKTLKSIIDGEPRSEMAAFDQEIP
jgi:hypothetical protein